MSTNFYEDQQQAPAAEYAQDGQGFPDLADDLDRELQHELGHADEDAVDDGQDDGEDEAASAGKGKASAKPARALFRRTAAKALEVQAATDTVRAAAASVLGSAEDTVELTVSIMSAPRMGNSPLRDIEAISTACQEDPFEAAITAGELGRPRLKAVWSLLHAIGAVGTPAAPPSDAKAALAVVKAVNKLSDDQQLDLAAAGELLKRS